MATQPTSGPGTMDIISGGVQAAAVIANTVAGIVDQTQRRRFEQSLALLSNQQQQALALKMMSVQTQTQRLQILSDGILQYTITAQGQQTKSQTTMLILAGVLSAALITVVVIFSLKKKSSGN